LNDGGATKNIGRVSKLSHRRCFVGKRNMLVWRVIKE
jgi:hypothetical protein